MQARAIAHHTDGRRIFRTLEIALLAQQNTARDYGVCSGIIRLGIGYAMMYDPVAAEYVDPKDF
jgi:hypothetical protein